MNRMNLAQAFRREVRLSCSRFSMRAAESQYSNLCRSMCVPLKRNNCCNLLSRRIDTICEGNWIFSRRFTKSVVDVNSSRVTDFVVAPKVCRAGIWDARGWEREVLAKREVETLLVEDRDWIAERVVWNMGSGCRNTEDFARRKFEIMTSG